MKEHNWDDYISPHVTRDPEMQKIIDALPPAPKGYYYRFTVMVQVIPSGPPRFSFVLTEEK